MASSFRPLFMGAGADAAAAPAWLSATRPQGGFTPDAHLHREEPAPDQEQSRHDAAYAEGERAGHAAAMAEMELQMHTQGKLGAALARLDHSLAERLSGRLSETVLALCEATLAPLTTDPDALQRRCIAAAGAVGEGIIDASLRLHPDDIALLDPGFAATWHLVHDPELERGTIEFDMPEGAVRDGPEEWRSALRDALGLRAIALKADGP